jgi:release factor glutamine methyltransferase
MTRTTTLTALLTEVTATLAHASSVLHTYPQHDLRREAEALVLSALDLPRSTIYQQSERELTDRERAKVIEWAQRRQQGVPLAYLCGHREFWSLSLQVTPDVLIPRPETELLVERALIRGRTQAIRTEHRPKVLELGTGSGAIILALRSEHANWDFTAVDVSTAALRVAQRNAMNLGLDDIHFVLSSWFTALPRAEFDLIISNPPYVAANDPCLEQDSLRYEPKIALTPGDDAMQDLRQLIKTAPSYSSGGGWLLLEHGHNQAEEVRAEMLASGYTEISSHRDLAGQWRVSEGRTPS